ncbi:RsiV family protein [Legionella spiritensis]|uniref:Endo-1,4-beta-xylanase-like protein n=1 Tax=Legionella spiritensis TaxID=452 RepID=A0A0W0YWT3_LEGSP|nr:RsiV family protein [Legionella spiritensis]KTD61376.1 endo-1,4-beta-xylanase-like protein [Legionella spiritensis]SNV33671.1 endo-1,4-beta-xylanase-like protein [Legionella spiritensis]
MKKSAFIGVVLFFLLPNVLWSSSTHTKTISIKKETATQVTDIEYPQGFADGNMDTAVANLISDARHAFEQSVSEQGDLPADVPGKNGLTIRYKIMFQNKRAASILFHVSSYSRGAAHPNNSVRTLNFIDGRFVALNDLFQSGSHYMTKIASYCRSVLQKKNISDAQWLDNGTKGIPDNYKSWYFSQDGLTIVFDTYQVAAYVYGPQSVTVPRSLIASRLSPGIKNALWGQ